MKTLSAGTWPTSKILLAVLFIVPLVVDSLSYSGFCFKEWRYLSINEKLDTAGYWTQGKGSSEEGDCCGDRNSILRRD
jgi:hypothetical protein